MSAEVEVVVLHYKRPANIRPILQAFRGQTVPVKITLIDAHAEGFALDDATLGIPDDVITLSHNIGSFTRYAAGFTCDRPFTYFHDDDLLPGCKAVEHFLRSAARLADFGLLGQIGRYSAGGRYCAKNVLPASDHRTVDSVVRGYFLRSAHLHHILRLRWEINWDGKIEDDLLAACAMRLYGGLPIVLTPAPTRPDERINAKELQAPHAMCRRRNHLVRRSMFIRQMHDRGWRSLKDSGVEPAPGPTPDPIDPLSDPA